ncbi:MAG: KTSC domain-containing protein [Burkholderiaceae bacterium]
MNKLLAIALGALLLAAADAALAERVYVKARGEVELAPFKCEGVARSPNVKRICYDETHQYALVSLNGIWYHYCEVPASTIAAWRKSREKGRYYNDTVRGHFECTGASMPMYGK